MALQEQPREDLLRDAVALVERAQLTLTDSQTQVVVGFRAGGEVSFFFDEDPVYQFNGQHQLRRAYCDGKLIKPEAGRLIALDRQRSPRQVALMTHPLSADETYALLDTARGHLRRLLDALSVGQYQLVGQVPAEANVVARAIAWLEQHADQFEVADTPFVG